MSRTAERGDLADVVRIRLVEGDVDALEASQKELVDALNSIRKVLMGMLVSVTTASILLAVNAFLLTST